MGLINRQDRKLQFLDGRCKFPTKSCKFPTEEIMAQILNFASNFHNPDVAFFCTKIFRREDFLTTLQQPEM